MRYKLSWLLLVLSSLCAAPLAAQEIKKPIPLIFDTDIGNDCDDVQALAIIHALQSRGECELLAVTITKDEELAAPFTDAINTFYGRGDIPIGVCRSGVTPDAGKYNGIARIKDEGQLRFPHDLKSGKDAPDAVTVLRKALAGAEDGSVVICQVGFSTNLANLLDSPGDEISKLSGLELVQQKVRLLSVMAAAFTDIPDHQTGKLGPYREYNVMMDIPAARRLVAKWPTPIVWSGFEIGINLTYPHQSIEQDFGYVKHHPVSEAYIAYNPPPHDRPTWDLTSVLYAIRPHHNYFDLSSPGRVTVQENGYTKFEPDAKGRDRFLVLTDKHKARTTEALRLLCSQPPQAAAATTTKDK